jgi:hypothetical protein
MQKHIKTLFPSGWYYFRITQFREDDHRIWLTFTCDVGERAYQHIIMEISREYSEHILHRMCKNLGINPVGSINDAFFSVQFLAIRCEAKVDMDYKDGFNYNILIDWRPAMVDADWNVLRPRTEDYFYQQKNPKQLPI